MTDYFQLAVDLTRAEAAPTLAKVAKKYVDIQRIAAYEENERSYDDIDREMRRNFDADEAQFINGGGAW